MTPKFQNRLVGAVILVALGVIILPDVFDGEKKHYQEEVPPIPLRADIDEQLVNIVIENPIQVDDVILPKEVVSDITTEQPVNKAAELANKPREISQGSVQQAKQNSTDLTKQTEFKKGAWIIRLGTFRNHANANALAEKLKKQGFPAQVKPKNLRRGDLARVEVGPELSEKKVTTMQAELETVTGLKGQVIKFNPVTL